jgi:hypothetical protein
VQNDLHTQNSVSCLCVLFRGVDRLLGYEHVNSSTLSNPRNL